MTSPDPLAGDQRRGRLLLAIALLSGCCLMWPMATAGPLVLDEHGSYWIVDSGLPGSSLERSLNYAAIPPLSSWLQMLSLAVFGKSEWAFRLPSAFCYLAAIGVIYLAGEVLADRQTGGLAALVLAWHPEALDEVRIARAYGLVLLLAALLLLITVNWWRVPRSRRLPVAWVATAAALIWTHYVAALFVLFVGLTLFAAPFRREGVTRIPVWSVVLTGSGGIALALPLVPALRRMSEWSPFLNYQSAEPSLGEIIGPVWWLGLPIGVIVASLQRSRDGSATGPGWPRIMIALFWTLAPLLCLAGLATGSLTSLANPRYRVPFAAAGALLSAMLLRWRPAPFVLSLAGAVCLLAASWWAEGTHPFRLGRLSDALAPEWQSVAERIERDGLEGEPVFVQSGLIESSLVPVLHDDPLFMEYVACRAGRFYLESPHPRYGLPFLWDEQTGVVDFYGQLLSEEASPRVDTFWVACALDTDLNRNSLDGIRQIAEFSGFEVAEEHAYDLTALLRFTRTASGDH